MIHMTAIYQAFGQHVEVEMTFSLVVVIPLCQTEKSFLYKYFFMKLSGKRWQGCNWKPSFQSLAQTVHAVFSNIWWKARWIHGLVLHSCLPRFGESYNRKLILMCGSENMSCWSNIIILGFFVKNIIVLGLLSCYCFVKRGFKMCALIYSKWYRSLFFVTIDWAKLPFFANFVYFSITQHWHKRENMLDQVIDHVDAQLNHRSHFFLYLLIT